MTCENAAKIHAYHDGELLVDERSAIESHLAICGECRELLNDLQKLTGLFATVELPEMPQRAVSRMYGSWHAAKVAQERGVRRLAGWLTAVAAAILVFVPLHSLPQHSDVTDHNVDETVAFLPPSTPREDSNSELVQVAQWMANDLSVDSRR
jgi:anti-sigma factor RsiW